MLRTGKYYIASLSWAVLGLLIAALAPFGAIAVASACKAIAALQRSVQALVYGPRDISIRDDGNGDRDA
jgi:hypothetical protein